VNAQAATADRLGPVGRAVGWSLVALAIAIRLHNALAYPPDWGFDASFNWRYIYRLSQDRALPPPDAGWSTGDPPLYFALGAAVMAGADALGARGAALLAVPLLGTAAGLGIVLLAVALVRRLDPGNERRHWLAGLLVLYLPAHVYASAMVNEEILAALLVALALFPLVRSAAVDEPLEGGWRRAAAVGVASGLAWLTKLSGVLVGAAAALSYALEGWRRGLWRRGVAGAALVGALALLSGGWYYVYNRVQYGYFQPYGLPAHQIMFAMPPGERGVTDYLRLPLATRTDPQLLNPALLRSVWGSTYATVWFDGHRFFLPRDDARVRRLGTLTLALALLPTGAFLFGAWRGLLRALRGRSLSDLPLQLLLGLTLAGYVAYTWRNPWFAVIKGTTLLGLSLPFAVYASEGLDRLLRRGAGTARAAGGVLLLLALCVACATHFGWPFAKAEVPGLSWEAPTAP
jgi:hypothetical protein